MPAAYQTSLELKPTTYQTYCRKLNYLVERQRELCGMNPNILQTVGRGAKMGIDECQHQFRMSRWNCTTFSNSSTVFGGVMDVRLVRSHLPTTGRPRKSNMRRNPLDVYRCPAFVIQNRNKDALEWLGAR
ncbi:hypothetical protein AVEN_28878-1 [Araneus ventricosus]|uniref:Protein Wnt n=1 Tax=Araneus ventricosus TaxID=182803 RepID=A0A4Y2AIW7_ARAVE|nr:hypothetical protein AVEN_28878-1 [Araneus ventricosus]